MSQAKIAQSDLNQLILVFDLAMALQLSLAI